MMKALDHPVRWLVPAALGGVITKRRTPPPSTQGRRGGANEPTDTTADRILEERGIAVIPDFSPTPAV